MHSFPQFTRSTLSGEFTWVGAIIFGGNFIVRGQFSGGQFSSGTIILGGNCLGGNYLGSNHPGVNCQGVNYPGATAREAIFLWGNYPRGQLSGGQLSGEQSSRGQSSRGQLSGGQFSSGAIVLEPYNVQQAEVISGFLFTFITHKLWEHLVGVLLFPNTYSNFFLTIMMSLL